jgi:hypothetical protein
MVDAKPAWLRGLVCYEKVSRRASSSASAFVSRLEVGQISSTIPASLICPIQPPVAGGEDLVPDPVGAQGGDDLTDLGDSVLAALLADVDRHPEAGVARLLDERVQCPVGVGTVAVRARAGDVDADDPARRVADRLLDDDLVLPLGERPETCASVSHTFTIFSTGSEWIRGWS